MIVQAAAQEDVDVVGLSILSGAHMEILPEILSLLKEQNMDDVVTVVGGIVPDAARQSLSDLGVSGVFGPGTSTATVVEFIQNAVKDKAKR